MAAEQPVPTNQYLTSSIIPPFLRDIRVLHIVGQVVFAIILVAVLSSVWTSIQTSLQAKNLAPNLSFLSARAGFDIAEHPAWYSSSSTYAEAFRVGVENSLRIIVVGLVLTTILGILGGIFLLSNNWLVRTLAQVVVEILRNTPLLVQLIGWYFVVMLSLPLFQESFTAPPEGVLLLSLRFVIYAAAIVIVWLLTRRTVAGESRRALLWNGLIAAIVVIEAAYHWLPTLYAYAQIANPLLIAYVIANIGVIGVIWYFGKDTLRLRLLGLALGEFIGGLLFYFGILPNTTLSRVEVYPAVMLSKRGLVLPEFVPTARFGGWLLFVAVGLIVAGALWVYWGQLIEKKGRVIRRAVYAPLIFVAFAVIGWLVVSLPATPATVSILQKDKTSKDMTIADAQAAGLWTRDNAIAYSQAPLLYYPPQQKISPAGIVSGLVSGSQVTPEYVALLVGLVVYTSAFIAEIVRAGILAVPQGQFEASRALGLSTMDILRIVILPQALRIIIPPLGNQYLNLSKNSSLAVAVAFADLVFVTETIMNQSGQSVTGITMIMVTYLIFSLLISAFINLVNRRFRIVTR